MSSKNARTLTQPSNRAKPKDVTEKKVVFKGVLDSPFRIQWPSVPVNLQNNVMAYIVQKLEGASAYRSTQSLLSRKRKRAAETTPPSPASKKPKIDAGTAEGALNEAKGPTVIDPSENSASQPPLSIGQNLASGVESPIMLRHLLYGINEVTKRLEIQTENARRPVILAVPEPTAAPTPLKYIFVCRADVDPALLIDHLPHLVAAYNSSHPGECVKLVTLPRGSELLLAKTLGIRRVTVLAIENDYHEDQLSSMMAQVPIMRASWLSKTNPAPTLIATHVKHLRTTAPKDMKAAKEMRNQQKSDAKKKK